MAVLMSAVGHEHAAEGSAHSSSQVHPISIPWVVFAAILCGIGLFLISYWVIFFYWPAFSGVLFVLAGAILLFNRRTGIDRA